jgi:hypothetical protein
MSLLRRIRLSIALGVTLLGLGCRETNLIPSSPTIVAGNPLPIDPPSATQSPTLSLTPSATISTFPTASGFIDTTGLLLLGFGTIRENTSCALWWVTPDGEFRGALPAFWVSPDVRESHISTLRLSPQGKRAILEVLLFSDGGVGSTFILDLNTGDTIDLDTETAFWVDGFTWSADSQLIAYTKQLSGMEPVPRDLIVLNVRSEQQIAVFAGVDANFSTNSQALWRLVYASYPYRAPYPLMNNDLMIVEADGSETILATSETGALFDPIWTGNDQTILAVERYPDDDTPQWIVETQLVGFDVSTGTRRELLLDQDFRNLHDLQLSPDGTQLLSVATRGKGAGTITYPLIFDLDSRGFPTGTYHIPLRDPNFEGAPNAYWADSDTVAVVWGSGDRYDAYLYHADNGEIIQVINPDTPFPPDFCE